MHACETLISYLESSWRKRLQKECEKPYFQALSTFVEKEYQTQTIFPPKEQIFNAFSYSSYEKTNVVIVGQDPYHGKGQAHGLCFSVAKGVRPPPSLKNIFKEAIDDVGIDQPKHGCLTSWASQGVLMLNATLTVRSGQPKSHWGKGWEVFTDQVISTLSEKEDPIIFVLWGRSAQDKCLNALKNGDSRHLILKAAHPSPYAAHGGFFGCRHFSQINAFLAAHGKLPIDWNVR